LKVLIIAYYYPPISSGGSLRPQRMAEYLSAWGHRVTVVTSSYSGTSFDDPGVIRIHDISYNKDKRSILHRAQWFVLRIYTEILNCLGIYWSIYSWWRKKVNHYGQQIMEETSPDVLIATYPPVESLEVGLYLSEKFKVPLISDFRDGLLFESHKLTVP